MLELAQRFKEWLQYPRNRSRFIAGVIGAFVLVGAVLFSSQIDNLLSLFGSRAGVIDDEDLAKQWELVETSGGEERAHAKLIAVDQGETKWLYVVGGLDAKLNYLEGYWQTVLLKSVQKIQLHPQTGAVLEGTTWQEAPDMNFGHAEFGLAQVENYLYVIAGDIHVPPEQSDKVPLLYSTVERLDLTNADAEWEVVSLLAGVNFYPEVLVSGDDIHVVGGVYGSPFTTLPNTSTLNPIEDLLMPDDDGLWNTLGLANKPVIGNVTGSDGTFYLPKGAINSQVQVGSDTTPGPVVVVPREGGTTFDGLQEEPAQPIVYNPIPAWLPTAQASYLINVLNPAAGEKIFAPSTYTIRWSTTAGLANPLRIDWRTRLGAEWQTIYEGPGPTPDNSPFGDPPYFYHYNWPVPPTNASRAQVRVCYAAGTPGSICSASDEFSITTQQSIIVNTPTAGEFVDGGSDYLVTWSTQPGVNIPAGFKVDYSVDGGASWSSISSAVYGNQVAWQVPEIGTDRGLIRVADRIHSNDVYGISGEFSIIGGGDIAEVFSDALISGDFVTTVGEHFVINTAAFASSYEGELGSDYIGTLSDRWRVDEVTAIGHLRFTVTPDAQVVPVPQGRYGHRLVRIGTLIYTLGGASWSRELTVAQAQYRLDGQTIQEYYELDYKNFWVIDDDTHPFYQINYDGGIHDPVFDFGRSNYQFVGNISYRLGVGNTWHGTNADPEITNRTSALSSGFAFKSPDGSVSQGRAFFGLDVVNGKQVAVGGLRNSVLVSDAPLYQTDKDSVYAPTPPRHTTYFWIEVDPVASVEELESGTWIGEQPYITPSNLHPIYNIAAFGLDGGIVTFTGQVSFQYEYVGTGGSSDALFLSRDAHVPYYAFPFAKQTAMYIPQTDPFTNRWYAMADVPETLHSTSATHISLFAANYRLTTGTGLTRTDIVYRYGGKASNNLLVLGPFGGDALVPDHVDMNVEPSHVYADGVEYSTIEITVYNAADPPQVVPNTIIWLSQSDPSRQDFDFVTAAASWEPIQRISPDDLWAGGVFTNANGVAKFEVRSTLAGEADFCVGPEFGLCFESLSDHPRVTFVPVITELEPPHGVQGETLPVVATVAGLENLGNVSVNDVNVSFGQSQTGSLTASDTMKEVDANGSATTTFTVNTQLLQPDTLTATITSAPGSTTGGGFDIGRDRQRSDEVEATDSVTYEYRAGTQPGVSIITFEVEEDSSVEPVKILVVERTQDAFYSLALTAEDDQLEEGQSTGLTATLESGGVTAGGETVYFVASDDSTVNPASDETDSNFGQASSTLTVNSAPGDASVVAYTFVAGSAFYFDDVLITKLPSDDSLIATVTSTSNNAVTFSLAIGPDATIGFWQIYMQIGGTWTNIEMPGNDDFEVYSSTGPGVSRLESIDPDRSKLGTSLTVNVTGVGTHFQTPNPNWGVIGSTLTFAPSEFYLPKDGSGNPLQIGNPQGIQVSNLQAQSLTRLTAEIEIDHNATPGWWNIAVLTVVGNESETAVLLGERDFLVTVDEDGYFIVLSSDKYVLPPDGQSQANLVATVGQLNNNTGVSTLLGDQEVRFSSTDDIENLPAVNPTEATTNIYGQASSVYTVNDEVGTVTIFAETDILYPAGGIYRTLSTSLDIEKAIPSDHGWQLKVMPHEVVIDLASSQHYTTLTVSLEHEDGSVRSGQVIDLLLSSDISPIPGGVSTPVTTNLLGEASATYFAFMPGTVTVDAYANVPDVGPITTVGTDPHLGAVVEAIEGEVLDAILHFFTPFQENTYQYKTDADVGVHVVVLGQNEAQPLINGRYIIDDNDKVVGLPNVQVVNGRPYDVWIKGAYHLAVVKPFTGREGIISLIFSTNDTTPHSAFIGDIVDTRNLDGSQGSFNYINSLDYYKFIEEFFDSGANIISDLDGSGRVDSLDWWLLLPNWLKKGDPELTF